VTAMGSPKWFFPLGGLLLVSAAMAAQIDVPLKQWVAVGAPTRGNGVTWGHSITNGLKHVTIAVNPDNGRLYFTAGDYAGGPFAADQQSYRQETWSLSLAARLASSDRSAGWTLEYPYCGPANQIQPKHPDFGGWTWDTKRHLFWWVPGLTLSASSGNCPGESDTNGSDPQFVSGRLMTFDTVGKMWADKGALPAGVPTGNENWMAHYDPVTDTLVRFARGEDLTISVYDITNQAWTSRTFTNGGKTIYVEQEYIAWDPDHRRAYMIDYIAAHLLRYDLDAHIITDLGPVPHSAEIIADHISNHMMVVYDPNDDIVFWYDTIHYRFHAYHADRNEWESDLPTSTNDPGVYAYGRMMVFDKDQNVLFLGGGTADPPDLNPGGGTFLQPNFYLYRYSSQGGQPPSAQIPARSRRLRVR
jgi:hypothetical protein